MDKKLLIKNEYNFHYEIIESVIVKYNEILKIEKKILLIYTYIYIQTKILKNI